MMKITLICVGKLKESYWQSAENEYLKRLGMFAKIEIKEIREESFSVSTDKEKIKKNEARKIIATIPKDAKIIVLDEIGKEMSSKTFAKQIGDYKNIGESICLIIGGPLGLDDDLRNSAHDAISLSRLTFTHQMARVFILEQLYRAFMISNGRNYHY
ncbi:MAG TPA: 23S rRNA (pseudouridine(1915)-N(3))-methyltransferase RlmH [Candidatus Magasanikbacteria bacterium]|nr:23S rRNA (pseudouridine(1915)-N(3))-methyltransferase RlmH [Candidatus Magasanikbacteria bacterium]